MIILPQTPNLHLPAPPSPPPTPPHPPPPQDFSIDDTATCISFPPGCVAPANAAGLAKALSSKRRPHVHALDLQVKSCSCGAMRVAHAAVLCVMHA
jgi:hypothetical protein